MSEAPLLFARIVGEENKFRPQSTIECEYELDGNLVEQIDAIETSLIWLTEGKGDEDLGVHFFARRRREQLNQDPSLVYRFQSKLPESPLTYDGKIIKIRWCARVRVFLKNAASKNPSVKIPRRSIQTVDIPFQLGNVDWNEVKSQDSESSVKSDDNISHSDESKQAI